MLTNIVLLFKVNVDTNQQELTNILLLLVSLKQTEQHVRVGLTIIDVY